ncbi:MAG TPA: nuclease-related domain-containing protein [Lacunisphaera sp.]|jgi:hypothetical protein
MKPQYIALLFVVAAMVLFVVMIIGIVVWLRWRRKTKWPFKTDDKLLRGPGEELKVKIAYLDERLVFEVMAGICLGLLSVSLFGDTIAKAAGLTPTKAFGLGLFAMLAVYAASGWRIARIWQRRQNCYLGWFGERYVAERLEPAKLQGWRVFHDVPFENNGKKFNIDHIVVGLGGVVAVETKTRRKGNARRGRKDSEVYFNGRALDWPWGEDTHGLDQAEWNAQWLTDWIHAEIGEQVFVSPILALPGWWLENKITQASRACAVVNPKWLPDLLAEKRPVLTQKLADLIARRLESRCRDVVE